MAREAGFAIDIEERGAYEAARCPLCELVFQRMTTHALMAALCDHMNAEHPEPIFGTAQGETMRFSGYVMLGAFLAGVVVSWIWRRLRATTDEDQMRTWFCDCMGFDQDPDAQEGVCCCTHGEPSHWADGRGCGATGITLEGEPELEGQPVTVEDFEAGTPEKLELLNGWLISAERGQRERLLWLLLVNTGLRRLVELVGHKALREAIDSLVE